MQKNQLQVAKYEESCTVFFLLLIRINGLVVMTGRRALGYLGSISDERSAAPPPFCVALSPSVH